MKKLVVVSGANGDIGRPLVDTLVRKGYSVAAVVRDFSKIDNLYESVLYYRHMKENLGEIAQTTEIYVDMDGVLADFFGEWAKLMKVDHFSKIDKEHKIGDALQAIRDKDDFWLNLPLLPQAKQLLSVIKQIKGEYNICSSPLADDPNSEPHKREWIKKNLAFFPPKEVIITHNKPQYATQQDGTPNILIDDFGKNVSEWEAAGGTAFQYTDHKFERTAKAIQQHMLEPVEENFADGKKKGKSRPGRAKRAGVDCSKSKTELRKIARNSSGEKQKMAHFCANMKKSDEELPEEDAEKKKKVSKR